ncbi:carbohydrate-binding protein, partial [Actinomycetota bacterium]
MRSLVVVVALAMVVAGAPTASAGDLEASAGDLVSVAAAVLQADELSGEVADDDDPIDVSDPKPASPGTRDEREPAPSGRVRSGPHSADARDIETNNLEPVANVVPGSSKVVEIPLKANEAAFAGTPLTVVVDKTGFAKTDRPQARIVVNDGLAPPEGALTSLFRVDLEHADGSAFSPAEPLKLKLDFSGHASTLQANLAGRLELVYYDGCRRVEHLVDEETQTFESVTVCDVVRPLETTRDDSSKTLTATLDPDAVVGGGGVVKGEVVRQLNSGSGWYGYGGGAGDSTGTYVATPFANVADYQVSLFTGAFATSYPIAVPPSPAGPAPSVSLSYSSAAVDGMRSDKNNQPGPIGTGWSLGAGGSITRHFNTSCTNGSGAILDPCPLDDEYSLTLNGVGSRLIYKSTSGGVKEFRLESDPMWRIEMKTNGSVARESHGEYWVVTTPDGTQYEFGNTDDSLDHVPVYTFNQPGPSCSGYEDAQWSGSISHVCYKAWRWNLDKVTDTFGNEMLFDYRQELDYYRVRTYSSIKGEVIRASHVERIRYAKVNGTFRAQVLFDYEVRCKDPLNAADCDEDNELIDTPVDLACRYADASCDNDHPSYFTELNLDGIRTQVYESGKWNTVARYDLDQSFPQNNGPTSTEVESPAKLWLNSVTQRPGSDSGWSAFAQLEAEDRDGHSSTSITKTSDWGAGQHVQGTHDGDWIRFDRVDFAGKAYKALARYSSDGESGNIEVILDDLGNTPVATIPITSTGSWNSYDTVAVNGLNISGIHNVYFRFDNTGSSSKLVNLNWVRFKASEAQMGGLNPTEFEPAVDASGYYHRNRAENLSALLSVGRPPIRLPRVGKLITTLQGQVDVTYGQDHGWDSEAGVCHQNAGNLHSGPECDYFDSWYDGDRVHFNIWKVKKVESYDAFSENATNTVAYTYSRPGWRWTETPGYSDTSCTSGPCNTYADFRGHEKVTVTRGTAASGTDGIEEHLFFQGLNGSPNYSGTKTVTRTDGTSKNDDNWLAGRQTETRTFDEATWASRTVTDYTGTATVTGEAYFVAPSKVVSYTNWSGGSNPRLTTTYGYDSYGNVTSEVYNSTYDSSTDRNVTREFLYNTSKWILGSPKNETLWEGTDAGDPDSADEKSYSRFYYQSGTTSYSNSGPPDTGAVKRVRAYSKREGTDVYSATDFTYDSMGRVTHVTDPEENVVETHYHSATGFADWVDNAKDHRITLETDAAYGAPTKITDPNGNVTEVAYDDYGRTTDVWLPTEPKTSGVASLEFDYTLATASSHAMTESRQLVERSSDVYLESYDFFDGFGRVVQSQSLSETSGYRNLSSRYFSERGTLRREAVVHRETGTPGSGYYDETWTGSSPSMSLQTVYTVNDLDQVTSTETIADDSAPDVMFTESMDYDGLTQTATDRNGVDTDYVYDVFGNMAAVTEHLETASGPATYTTGYDYDVANRLTTVHNSQESGHGDDIVITYDLLGRKKTMADPDMGDWSYDYDKAGNLEFQNDGRGDVVAFTYDALNRPLAQYDTSTSGDKIAEWAYDKTGEKGFLNNTKSYESNVLRVTVDPLGYDARGRVTSTKWTVAGQGAGPWTVSQTYDPADRIETLTYPTGETVTYEYSDRTGQPTSLDTDVAGDHAIVAA